MAKIWIDVFDKSAKEALDHLDKISGTFTRVLFSDFGAYMVNSIRTNFLVGGRPDPWAPLKFTSVHNWALKRKTWRKGQSKLLSKRGQEVVKGRKPLIDTGGLMGSIHWKLIPKGVAVGTNKAYAAIQQFGGPKNAVIIRPKYRKALYWPLLDHPVMKSVIPAGAIPARPFLVVQPEDWKVLLKRAGELLLFGIK
jgi:phage gpG-like protein